jgi:hypothetical protein
MVEAMEVVPMTEPQQRFRNSEEQEAIRTKIVELRLKGKTFEEIASIVSFHERHVRRLYHQFLFYNNQNYNFRRNLMFGELIHNYEQSIELSNKQLAKAIEENDPRMILLWQKTRQESLRDYHGLLKDLGLSDEWISCDPSKPFFHPDHRMQPWPGECDLDSI